MASVFLFLLLPFISSATSGKLPTLLSLPLPSMIGCDRALSVGWNSSASVIRCYLDPYGRIVAYLGYQKLAASSYSLSDDLSASVVPDTVFVRYGDLSTTGVAVPVFVPSNTSVLICPPSTCVLRLLGEHIIPNHFYLADVTLVIKIGTSSPDLCLTVISATGNDSAASRSPSLAPTATAAGWKIFLACVEIAQLDQYDGKNGIHGINGFVTALGELSRASGSLDPSVLPQGPDPSVLTRYILPVVDVQFPELVELNEMTILAVKDPATIAGAVSIVRFDDFSKLVLADLERISERIMLPRLVTGQEFAVIENLKLELGNVQISCDQPSFLHPADQGGFLSQFYATSQTPGKDKPRLFAIAVGFQLIWWTYVLLRHRRQADPPVSTPTSIPGPLPDPPLNGTASMPGPLSHPPDVTPPQRSLYLHRTPPPPPMSSLRTANVTRTSMTAMTRQRLLINGVEVLHPELFSSENMIIHRLQRLYSTSSFSVPAVLPAEAEEHVVILHNEGFTVIAQWMHANKARLADEGAMTIFASDDLSISAGAEVYYVLRRFTYSELLSYQDGSELTTLDGNVLKATHHFQPMHGEMIGSGLVVNYVLT